MEAGPAWTGAVLFVVVLIGVVLPVLGMEAVRLGSSLGTRLGARKRTRQLTGCLPTSTPVVAYIGATAPPLRVRAMRRLAIACIPFYVLGPFFFFGFWWLMNRWHPRHEVVITDDGTAWVTRPVSIWRPRKRIHIVGSESLQDWHPTKRDRGLLEGTLAGVHLGLLPGSGTEILASGRWHA